MIKSMAAIAEMINNAIADLRVPSSRIDNQLSGTQVAPAAPGSPGVVDLDTIPTISAATPQPLGTATPGNTGTASDAAHVHTKPTPADIGAESSLGNPGTSGFVLASTTAGVRSWVAQVSTLAWSAITGKPTTVATSGLTDAVATSDSRLSDARTPTAHTQAFTSITGTLADTQLSANVPRLNAANTFVTGQAVGSGVGDAQFVFDGGAGKVRDMLWSSGGLPRWILRATSTAETGSDVGSDFQIISRDDYGNFKAAVATITRSNSAVALAGHVAVGGGLDVGTAMGATTGMIRGKTDTGYIDILVTSVDRDGRVGFAVGSAYGSLVSQTATGSASRALAVTALGTWIGKTSGLTGAGDLDVAGKLNVDGVTTLGDTLTVQLATTPAASLSATGGIVLSHDASRGVNIAVGSSSPTGRPMLEFTKSRGTLAAPVAVANGDLLGTITAKAYDAAAVPTTQANGYIAFAVAGVVSAGVIPVAIDFYTSATNAANIARRLRVMPTGSVLIGKATGLTGAGDLDVAGKLNVDGTLDVGGVSDPLYPVEFNGADRTRATRATGSTTTGIIPTLVARAKTTGVAQDGYGPMLQFTLTGSAGVNNHLAHIGAVRNGADNQGALVFYTASTPNDEKMRIAYGGNVLIGTTTDATQKLQVVASAGAAGRFERTTTATNTGMHIVGVQSTTTGDMADGFGGGFYFQIADATASAAVIAALRGIRDGGDLKGALQFLVNNTLGAGDEAMRISTNRALLVGKTSGLTGAGDLDVAGALNVDGTTTLGNATTLGDGATDTSLAISGGTGKSRDLYFQTGTSNRWIIRASSDAESGLDVGSNFQIISRTDSGSNKSTVLTLTRSTGAASFAGAVTVTGTLTATGGIVGEAWTNITTFSGDWVAYGGTTYAPPGYWKDALGIVHLRGLVKYGTAPITLPSSPFTLPTQCRPQYASVFACMTNDALGRVDVLANGQVMVRSSSSVYVSLDSISFRAYP